MSFYVCFVACFILCRCVISVTIFILVLFLLSFFSIFGVYRTFTWIMSFSVLQVQRYRKKGTKPKPEAFTYE